MKEATTTAYYLKGTVPAPFAKYLKEELRKAPRGRDGLIESSWLQRTLDFYPWADKRLEHPGLRVGSKWMLAVGKRGIGADGRKTPGKRNVYLSPELQLDIVERIKSIDALRDNFILSDKYNEMHVQLEIDYGETIPKDLYAEVIITKRKQEKKGKKKGHVYFFLKAPTIESRSVKIGWTSKDPDERMKSCTQTMASEPPIMLGYFYGDTKDERKTHKKYANCRVQGEIFRFNETQLQEVYNFIKNQFEECGGWFNKNWKPVIT